MVSLAVYKKPSMLKESEGKILTMNVDGEKVRVSAKEVGEIYNEYAHLLSIMDNTERNTIVTRSEYRKTPSKYNLICNMCGFTKQHYEAEMLSAMFGGS